MKHNLDQMKTGSLPGTAFTAERDAVFRDLAKADRGIHALSPMIPDDHPYYGSFDLAIKDADGATNMLASFIAGDDEEAVDKLFVDNGLEHLREILKE